MKIFTFLLVFAFLIFLFYLFTHQPVNNYQVEQDEKKTKEMPGEDSQLINSQSYPVRKDSLPVLNIFKKNVRPDSLVAFAESLIGIPYKYASTDPSAGFDCSGFITYVFNHYDIQVPRSSKDFKNTGTEIPISKGTTGDLILFTGTDSTERIIGHMGIIISNNNKGLKFIHSTSGKAYGVVITEFNKYYQGRFVKVIRIFN